MITKDNNIWKIIKSKNQSPWGGGNDNGNSEGKKSSPENKDIDDQVEIILKKGQEFIKKMLQNNNQGGGSRNTRSQTPNNNLPKSVFGLVIMGFAILWLASGLYKINPDENGLVLYFGKVYSIATPGLNYHLPAPFAKVIKKSVTTVNTQEFSYASRSSNTSRSVFSKSFVGNQENANSLMLTGDENIVDIDFQIQWQIADIKNFVLNVADPELAIRKAAESAMREIIAKTPIADALSDGKRRIELETKTLLQEILDSYSTGVHVVLVQMLRVDPPKQVIDSFRDVQTAKADKEKEINQAQAYKNDIIPRARGEAAKITEQALAYKQEVVADAEGQASRFMAVYRQYAKSKFVTKKRMYLENMEKIYKDIDKIIVDKNISKSGAIPYLPLGNFNKK